MRGLRGLEVIAVSSVTLMASRSTSAAPRSARSPADLSRGGWRDVARRTLTAMSAQQMSLIAAGIAYYWIWAFFPALAAMVVFGGVLFGREEILHALSWIRFDLPESFNVVVVGQLESIAREPRGVSVLTLGIAAAIATWSAMRGVRGLIGALNIIYAEKEDRSFWHRHLLAFAFAGFGIVFFLAALTLLLAFRDQPIAGQASASLFFVPSRWPPLIALVMFWLSVLYRYAPARKKPRWRWVTWGAGVSAVIWIAGTLAVSYYAAQYTRLNPLLGSLGAVVIFLFWSYLNVLTVLLGAQINAEVEREA